jgi:hypothetical protein
MKALRRFGPVMLVLILGLALPTLADCRLGVGAGTLVDQWTATPDSQTQDLISAIGVPAFCARSSAGPLWPCKVQAFFSLWEWYSTQNMWIETTNFSYSESIDCKQSIAFTVAEDWGLVEVGQYNVQAQIYDASDYLTTPILMQEANDYFTISRY